MKLWVVGGQCDDYYECVPDEKCNTCKLRFKCYTVTYFDVRGMGHEDRKLDAHEFYVFLEMSMTSGS